MYHPTEKKNLTQLEVIELLTLLKDHSEQEVADHFGITHQAVNYYKQKYGVPVNMGKKERNIIIDRIIAQLEKDGTEPMSEKDYKKQESCIPKRFYFKCHTCGFTASENNIQGIRDHLDRCTVRHSLLTEQTI